MVASRHVLRRACVEHKTECAQVEAARQDYRARLRAFPSGSKHYINFNWMLEECQIILSL
jgi:hypothetical protein